MTGFSGVPLADETQDDHDRRWAGVARISGPVWSQIPSLTVPFLGVQMLWSVEMSYASPYLLSLGLPKSLMAIVFLAGPLSGLIVQPIIGVLADNSKSRFGRRRPFILVSTALCMFAILLLGFTRPFATIFTTINSPSNDTLTVWLAILSIYCIDFCINAVQALDRALLVDILPTSKQPAGNAWAATMLALGSVAGFFVGNLDLPHFFPFFGSAQLEVLSVISALLVFLTQAWMCFHVKERVLLVSSSGPKGFRHVLDELWETFVRLPSVIRQICWVQFFAWLGWFPFLFYSTVYIGDLHKRSSPIPQTHDAAIALDAEATRLGTRAMFYSALVSLIANIVIPCFVVPRHASGPLESKRTTWTDRVQVQMCSLWALSHLVFAICMAATFITSTVSGATWIVTIVGFCWAMTLWAPSALLGEAILSHPTSDDVSIHLADTRLTHGGWMRNEHDAEETTRLFGVDDDDDDEGVEEGNEEGPGGPSALKRSLSQDSDKHDPEAAVAVDPRTRSIGLGHARARVSRTDIAIPPHLEDRQGRVVSSDPGLGLASKTGNSGGLSAQAGAILGIHNLFIVIPQFLVTGLSSIIFALFDPGKSVLHPSKAQLQLGDGGSASSLQEAARGLMARDEEGRGTDSIAIVFRFGGISAIVAFVLCYRLAKYLQRH